MRAGVFQCEGGGLTADERLRRLGSALRGEQLDLVVCPELFMSGYDVGDSLSELAEDLGGPFAMRVVELAQSSNTAIVYGYPESADGNLYNAAACVSRTGHLIANHRKILLPPGPEERYFEQGSGLTLFDLNGFCCSILICYDAEYPEAVRAAAKAGAQLIIVPTALSDKWETVAFQMMPTRAFENGVWLLYANHAGIENGSVYLGSSCIVRPDGKDAMRAGTSEELIYTDIELESVSAAQARLPYLNEVGCLRNILDTGN